ncbi:MAG TPA: response regulator, partial [Candidatus Sulfotelmatobacter sp.]|nr:response regulator [Candidatus Sulfotelmatobacter sp.]
MLSRWLQILAVALLVVIAGIRARELIQAREMALADASLQMSRLDMVFAEQTGRAFESVDLVLRGAIEGAAPRMADPDARDAVDAALQRRIQGVRQLKALDIADRAGRIVFSSRSRGADRSSIADQSYLADYRAGRTRAMQIGEPLRGSDGRWEIPMARPMLDADGAVVGIAVAAVDPSYFEDFYKAVDLAPDGAILLHRRDGLVLARYPRDDRIIGTSYAELPPFKDVLAHAIAGTVRMDSPIDGTPRVLAIRALRAFPLAVNVSIGEGAALAQWRRQTLLFSLTGVVAAGSVAILLLLLARQTRRLERANVELRATMEERERAQAALRQSQRLEAVGQLTGGVAHDFNNLLTVILASLSMLRRRSELGPEIIRRIDTIEGAARRGATLTDQLLAFSRKQPLVPAAHDLNRVIGGMTGLLRSTLGSMIEIETTLAASLWLAMVDPTQIELVILNLALNARDAMPDGGKLVIETANVTRGPPARPEDPVAGDYVMVSVTDAGQGMTEEVRARACEPFFTTKEPGKGSGLGLSQVFGVTRQLGGGLVIESAPGRGTSVKVYLPRAAASATAAEGPAVGDAVAVPPRPGRRRVLLVDDDEAVRGVTAGVLEDLDYRVVEAAGGDEALDWLRRDDPIDVMLTDLAMPAMNGAELARRVRTLRPGLPIVFLTGFADTEALAGDLRPERLVRKPFQPAELDGKLRA